MLDDPDWTGLFDAELWPADPEIESLIARDVARNIAGGSPDPGDEECPRLSELCHSRSTITFRLETFAFSVLTLRELSPLPWSDHCIYSRERSAIWKHAKGKRRDMTTVGNLNKGASPFVWSASTHAYLSSAPILAQTSLSKKYGSRIGVPYRSLHTLGRAEPRPVVSPTAGGTMTVSGSSRSSLAGASATMQPYRKATIPDYRSTVIQLAAQFSSRYRV